MNKLIVCSTFMLLFTVNAAFAQIADYTVRLSEDENKVEVVALQSSGTAAIRAKVDGDYLFFINGFKSPLKFDDGTAQLPQKLDNTTFLYIKHSNGGENIAHLYFLYRFSANGSFSVVHIPLLYLILVPFALILIGMFFRRLIIFAIIALVVLFYFSHSKGLDLNSFLDGIKEWLMSWL